MSETVSSSSKEEKQTRNQIDSMDNFDENKGSDSLFNKDDIKKESNENNNSEQSQEGYDYIRENKIKLNKDALKSTPLKKNNDEDNKKQEDELTPDIKFSGLRVSSFFTKLNRYLTIQKKKIIVIILLLFSITFFSLSIFDFLKKVKGNDNKKNKNYIIESYFMTCKIVYIIEVICLTLILIYQIINFFLSPKENQKIVLITILLVFISGIIRSIVFSTKKVNAFTILIYLIFTLILIIINCLTLILLFIDAKKNKKNQHNIEEIINFTEINSGIRKEQDKPLSNLQKINNNVLVEESDNQSKK